MTAFTEPTNQAGFTLIEMLVTVVVLSTGFALVVGGMGTSILASDYHRKQATSQTSLRTFAEAIKRAPYVAGCATPSSYAYPATRKVTDGVLSGTTVVSPTASFSSSDLGTPIAATGISNGTVIVGVTNSTTATMSAPAPSTPPGSTVALTIGDGLSRTVTDGSTTPGSYVVTSNSASFQLNDVGKAIIGSGIPSGTTIASVASSNSNVATVSAPATAPGIGVTLTISEARVTAVKYWNGTAFADTCPVLDKGLQLISVRVQSRDSRSNETVDIVKRQP